MPTDWLQNLSQYISLSDPVVQKIAIGAALLIVLVLVLRVLGRFREAAASRRRRAEHRRQMESTREQEEEFKRLAEQIVATSSTARLAGYGIIRQVETVVTDARLSSVAAVELLKSLAAQKGANGIVNLQTQQTPQGKWVASGDAVVVKLFERTNETSE